MHQNPLSIEEHSEVFIYPNPVSMESSLLFNSPYPIENVKLIDALGRVQNIDFSTEIYLSQYVHREGLYVLEYEVLGEKNRQKLIVR